MSGPEFSVENCMQFLTERGFSVQADASSETPTHTGETGKHSLCDGLNGVYSHGLHVGSIFLILGVSFLGTLIPIASKFIPLLGRYPFVFTVAKTAATGVLLSVSTIHLIYEGADAFREPCMNETLKLYGPAYFLFALVAVLLMQLLDIQLGEIAERWLKAQQKADAAAAQELEFAEDSDHRDSVVEGHSGDAEVPPPCDMLDLNARECTNCEVCQQHERACERNDSSDEPAAAQKGKSDGNATALATVETEQCASEHPSRPHDHAKEDADEEEDYGAHGHQHLVVSAPRDMGSVRRVISAICMEFGVTLHSVFVGLAIGLTTDAELKPLLVALVFHQLFEGMAMGSRLADAEFKGSLDIVLAIVFSVSAPAGMAAATIAVSVSRDAMSGTGFVTLMGVLDSFCGGILLYLAFTLLLGDFVHDLKHHCADGKPYRLIKKISMFAALWIGMGLMALIGNWL